MSCHPNRRGLVRFALCLLICIAAPRWAVAEAPVGVERAKTYAELRAALELIAARTTSAPDAHRLQVGPLVLADRDGDGVPDNNGLIPISAAEMDAIMHSVPDNQDPATGLPWNTRQRFGLSTMGRELLAARIGSREGTRVLVITQQHGNEYTGTEAALRVLRYLSFNRLRSVRRILDNVDLLMIVRANPDGGEPDAERCVMATDMYDGVVRQGSPFVSSVDGSLVSDCAFYRSNVDPRASDQTLLASGALYGFYGHGFNLNRYHFIGFDDPAHVQYDQRIYPVEAQAMVAVARAFKPQVIWDLHNNNEQVACDDGGIEVNAEQDLFYQSYFSPGLPRAGCVGTAKLVNTSIYITEDLGEEAKRLGAYLMQSLDVTRFGSAARYAQTSSTLPPEAGIADDSYGRYVYSDGTRPFFSATHEVANLNELVVSFQTDTEHQVPYEPGGDVLDNERARINLHRIGLMALLRTVVSGRHLRSPLGDGWDDLPKPELFLPAFSTQLAGAFSDPWFYIIFGELDDTDLASEEYRAAFRARGLESALDGALAYSEQVGLYDACSLLSPDGLCQSVIDYDPSDPQERSPAFQQAWRVDLMADYLHQSVQLTIDPPID